MPCGVVHHNPSSTRDPGPANTHRVFPQVTDHQIPPQKQHIKRRARSVHRRKPVGAATGLLGAVPQHRMGDEVHGGCRLCVELLSQGAQLLRGEGMAGLMAGLAGREQIECHGCSPEVALFISARRPCGRGVAALGPHQRDAEIQRGHRPARCAGHRALPLPSVRRRWKPPMARCPSSSPRTWRHTTHGNRRRRHHPRQPTRRHAQQRPAGVGPWCTNTNRSAASRRG